MKDDFLLGPWLIRPQLNRIVGSQSEVSVEPKVMEVLIYLARHGDDVVPKDRIIRAVWVDAFVTDNTLTHAISELRKALKDDPQRPRFIQTIPGRGYRLIATVTPSDKDRPPAPAAASNQLWKQRLLVVVAAVLLLAVALVMWWNPFTQPEAPIDSIAVLPFVNVTGDQDSEYLSAGIAGTISSSLSQLPKLRVVPSSALDRYRGQKTDPQIVARELDVRAVLTGTLLLRGQTLAVSVELVDGPENRLLWGERYIREFGDIFKLEKQIALQIAGGLRHQMRPEEGQQLILTSTKNATAYKYYLRGVFHSQDERSVQGQRDAIAYFEQAIALDPEYAQAYVALGSSWYLLAYYSTSEEAYQKAQEAYQTAFRLQPDSPEAKLAIARVYALYDRDWIRAEEMLNRVNEPDPALTSMLLPLLIWMDRKEEAAAAVRRWEKVGDRLSAEHHRLIAHGYYFLRRFDLAIEKAERAKQLDPQSNVDYLVSWCYEAKGMDEAAFQIVLSGKTAEQEQEYRNIFRESGMQGVRRRQLEVVDIERTKPIDVAGMYALAWESDDAFKWLELAYQLPVLIPFFTDARFDFLRDDPRYEQFLRKLNLPEEAIQRHLAAVEETR